MTNQETRTKVCQTCGRTFLWRKKWERSWDQVRYCSDQCRREKPGPLDARIEAAINDLLSSRGAGATICPSEAARAVDPEGWKPLMERTRRAARRLARLGTIEIIQGGSRVSPDQLRGPIRLRART
ncbi:MAG: DUF2256 and DUF3253 domain-containing protein [Phycisphaera sp.]|nr:MAG: DUF2256 and DUF3253 domain-containing protein [Phycisphaera sp.]